MHRIEEGALALYASMPFGSSPRRKTHATDSLYCYFVREENLKGPSSKSETGETSACVSLVVRLRYE
jgi:hypothetical protein